MKKCFEYQELISCLIDGELTEEERAELNAHLTVCPSCKAYLDILTAVSGAEAVEPPAELCAGVMSAVRKITPMSRKRRRYIGRWIAAAACFALILISVPKLIGSMGSNETTAAPSSTYMLDAPKAESAPEGDSEFSFDVSGIESGGTAYDGVEGDLRASSNEPIPEPSEAPEAAAGKNGELADEGLMMMTPASDPLEYFEAVVTIVGELPESLDDFERYDNPDGTFDIIVPDTLLPELLLLDAEVAVNPDADSGEVLVKYAP